MSQESCFQEKENEVIVFFFIRQGVSKDMKY